MITLILLSAFQVQSQQSSLQTQEQIRLLKTQLLAENLLAVEDKEARIDFLYRLSFKVDQSKVSSASNRSVLQWIDEISKDSFLQSNARMIQWTQELSKSLKSNFEPQQDLFSLLRKYLLSAQNPNSQDMEGLFEDQDYIGKSNFIKAKALDLDFAGDAAFEKLNPRFNSDWFQAIFSYQFEIPSN
jgi:hypothetical protein